MGRAIVEGAVVVGFILAVSWLVVLFASSTTVERLTWEPASGASDN